MGNVEALLEGSSVVQALVQVVHGEGSDERIWAASKALEQLAANASGHGAIGPLAVLLTLIP